MRRELVIFVGVAVVVSLVIAGYTGLFRVKYTPDTETDRYKYDPLGPDSFYLRGANYDFLDNGNADELLDQPKYISAFLPNGESETVKPSAKLECYVYSTTVATIDWCEIYVYLDSNPSDGWNEYESTPTNRFSEVIKWNTQDGGNPGRININTGVTGAVEYPLPINYYIFNIVGPHAGYFLKVVVKVRVSSLYYGETLVIEDEATIISGYGDVTVLPNPETGGYVFEEGETVTFQVKTGASGPTVGENNKGWILRIFKPDGTQYVGQGYPMEIDDWLDNARFTFVVPEGAWNPSGQNTWKVVLYNSLTKQSDDEFFTIDTREKAPEMKSISFTPEYPSVGDLVTVTLEGEPNSITESPIKEFEVDVYYGTQGNPVSYVYEDTRFTAVNNKATFTFYATHEGDIVIEAFCVDYDGRQSEEMRTGLTVYGGGPPSMNVGPGQYFVYNLSLDIEYPVAPDYKPELVRYTIITPSNKVIYVVSHPPRVAREVGGASIGNQKWHIEDKLRFQVPTLWQPSATAGRWNVKIEIQDKIMRGTYVTLATRSTSFNVVEGSVMQNAFAPIYYHKGVSIYDGNMLKVSGEINWKLPSPAVWIVIGIVIFGLIAFAYIRREQILRKLRELRK